MASADDAKAAKYREEARSQGFGSRPSPQAMEQMRQEVQDAKQRKAAESAPTTRATMGQAFKKGGAVRGWGKARGARKAKIV